MKEQERYGMQGKIMDRYFPVKGDYESIWCRELLLCGAAGLSCFIRTTMADVYLHCR